MKTTRTLFRSGVIAIAAAAALSGCMSAGPSGPSMGPAPQQTGVEGSWTSSDGVAVSRFSGGVFTTNALDTGNKLADGSYRMADPNTVEITVVSLIRNTTTNVNCALVSRNQLNCTSSTGTNFILTRRA